MEDIIDILISAILFLTENIYENATIIVPLFIFLTLAITSKREAKRDGFYTLALRSTIDGYEGTTEVEKLTILLVRIENLLGKLEEYLRIISAAFVAFLVFLFASSI